MPAQQTRRAPGREGALTSVTINERVHLDDIITPQPLRGGEQVITQAVHSPSKWIQSKALHDRSAKTAARWFYSEWWMRREFPAQITCDCEGAFISSFNTALADLAGIRVCPTSSYNPMSCSQAENIHPRCTDMLRCLSNPEEPDCAEWVLEAHFAHKHCEAAHHAYLFVLPRVWTQPCTPVNILAGVFMPSVAAEDEAELTHWFRAIARARELAVNWRVVGGAPTLEVPLEPR